MKYILILFLMLSACQKNDNSETTNNDSPTLIEDASVDIQSLSLSSLEISVEAEIDLGQVSSNVSKVITVVNSSSVAVPLQISVGSPFEVSLNRCSNEISARSKCQIVVSFNSRPLYNGTYDSTIVFTNGQNVLSIPISAEVIGKVDPDLGGNPQVSISMASGFSDASSSPSRSVVLKNTGTGTAKSLEITPSTGYKLSVNRCSDLKPNATCSISLLHDNYRKNTPPPDGQVVFKYEKLSQNFIKTLNLKTKEVIDPILSYTGTYTDFPVSTKTLVCSGTEIVYKTITECKDQYGYSHDFSSCPAPQSITYQSPEEELSTTENITGGTLYKKCLLGETNQINSRVVCNANTHFDNGFFACNPHTYTASFSQYSQKMKNNACDGTSIQTRTITSCVRNFDRASVSTSLCNDPTPSIPDVSPAGEYAIAENLMDGATVAGQIFKSCQAGETLAQAVNSRVSCNNPNYWALGLSCPKQIFSGQYAVVSNPVPNTCDGTQTLSRSLITNTCVGSVSSITHPDNLCNATQSQTFNSPSGNKVISLTGGSRTVTCPTGSNVQTFSSFTCDAGRFYTPAGSLSGTCNTCNAGSASAANQTSCSPCGTGQYQPNAGSASCLSCTNKPANATGVIYAASSGLTSNTCTVQSITSCEPNYGIDQAIPATNTCLPSSITIPRSAGLVIETVGSGHGYYFMDKITFIMQSNGYLTVYSKGVGATHVATMGGNDFGQGWTYCQSGGGTCAAIFQTDGNFVIYKGGTVLYNANTVGAFYIRLNSTPPYIQILNSAQQVIRNVP